MGYYTMQQEKTPCKIFAFAELQKLSKEATLSCFGAYYREEVLGDQKEQTTRTFVLQNQAGTELLLR
jgi:hypothetical protein